MAMSAKMAVFWVAKKRTPVQVYQRSEVLDSSILLMMDASRTSETSVNFYQTTRRYNPENSYPHDLTLLR
jgi:uncharacterized protein YjiK